MLKKPVHDMGGIIYWADSLGDARAVAEVLRRDPAMELTVRCPRGGVRSRCRLEGFTYP